MRSSEYPIGAKTQCNRSVGVSPFEQSLWKDIILQGWPDYFARGTYLKNGKCCCLAMSVIIEVRSIFAYRSTSFVFENFKGDKHSGNSLGDKRKKVKQLRRWDWECGFEYLNCLARFVCVANPYQIENWLLFQYKLVIVVFREAMSYRKWIRDL